VVDTVHALLMRADDHAQLVNFEELLDLVWPVAHDVVLLLWVSDQVWMHTELILGFCGVTPEQVHGHLLHSVVDLAEINLQWATNLIDVFELHNRGSEASVHAEDAVVSRLVTYDGTEWEPLEKVIHLLENTVWLVDVLAETFGALLSEA